MTNLSRSLVGLALLFSTVAPAAALVAPPAVFQAIRIGTGTKTATATAGAATLNKPAGTITTEALSVAATANYVLTITDSIITATDLVTVSVANGTNSAGTPVVSTVAPASGSLVITVKNSHATNAFNGTLKITFTSAKL